MKEDRKTYFSGHIENGVLWQFWPRRTEFVFTDPEIDENIGDVIGKYNVCMGTFRIDPVYEDMLDNLWISAKDKERMTENVANCKGFCNFLNEIIRTATTE